MLDCSLGQLATYRCQRIGLYWTSSRPVLKSGKYQRSNQQIYKSSRQTAENSKIPLLTTSEKVLTHYGLYFAGEQYCLDKNRWFGVRMLCRSFFNGEWGKKSWIPKHDLWSSCTMLDFGLQFRVSNLLGVCWSFLDLAPYICN